MKYKKCSTCGIEKPINEFHKKKSAKIGYASQCKSCQSPYHKEYYKNNKEKIAEYYENNIIKINREKFNLSSSPEELKPYLNNIIKARNLIKKGKNILKGESS